MFMSISGKLAQWWLSQNIPNAKSTLVQVMAWCCQATSHYISSTWANVDQDLCHHTASLHPNELTTPQTLNCLDGTQKNICFFFFISHHSNGVGSQNPSSGKTRTCLSCTYLLFNLDCSLSNTRKWYWIKRRQVVSFWWLGACVTNTNSLLTRALVTREFVSTCRLSLNVMTCGHVL